MINENNIHEEIQNTADELDYTFRPKSLNEFLGQKKIKENLSVYIKAAKQRNEAIDHIIFSGPPGLGKTTLASIISNEMGTGFYQASAPALEKKGDLAALLTKLQDKDVFFIDEMHRLRPELEEILYSAMEDYKVNIIIGQGISANSITLQLPRFTLIGATTRMGLLTRPLISRFGIDIKLDLYKTDEIMGVVYRTADLMELKIDDQACREISRRSRGTPRIANKLMRRIRDFAQVLGDGSIDKKITDYTFEKLDIDDDGLTFHDRKFLNVIIENHNGGPVGIDTLAVSIGETTETIEDVIEPYLIQKGYITRTPRGRCAAKKSYEYFNKVFPTNQNFLF